MGKGLFGNLGGTGIRIPTFGNDKPKGTKVNKSIKESVWLKYHGHKMNGKCYVCKRPISFMQFETGHNKPYSKGGKANINNLRTICGVCNRSMGTSTIESYKKKHFSKHKIKKKVRKPKKKKVCGILQEEYN